MKTCFAILQGKHVTFSRSAKSLTHPCQNSSFEITSKLLFHSFILFDIPMLCVLAVDVTFNQDEGVTIE